MKTLRLFILSSILSVSWLPVIYGQETNDAQRIVGAVKRKISKVRDFSADITITVNVDFLKAPASKAKVYFKQPDKSTVKSEGGFAMLPKQGLGIPVALLRSDYTPIFMKREEISGVMTAVIKAIPIADTGNILLTTFWINEKDSTIRRMVSTTKQGNIAIDFEYSPAVNSAGLPVKSTITFELPPFALPKSLTGDMTSENKPKREPNKPVKGNAVVMYSNFVVNKGIPDEISNEKK